MAANQEVERIAKKLDRMVHKKNTVRNTHECREGTFWKHGQCVCSDLLFTLSVDQQQAAACSHFCRMSVFGKQFGNKSPQLLVRKLPIKTASPLTNYLVITSSLFTRCSRVWYIQVEFMLETHKKKLLKIIVLYIIQYVF